MWPLLPLTFADNPLQKRQCVCFVLKRFSEIQCAPSFYVFTIQTLLNVLLLQHAPILTRETRDMFTFIQHHLFSWRPFPSQVQAFFRFWPTGEVWTYSCALKNFALLACNKVAPRFFASPAYTERISGHSCLQRAKNVPHVFVVIRCVAICASSETNMRRSRHKMSKFASVNYYHYSDAILWWHCICPSDSRLAISRKYPTNVVQLHAASLENETLLQRRVFWTPP